MLRFVRLLVLFAAAALLVPAAADAKSVGVTYPTVKKVSPKKAGIGDTMTITGTGFRKGKNKNTVLFRHKGGRVVFVRVSTATATKLTLVLPAKLLGQLTSKADAPQATRFNLRVLSRKLAKRYTKDSLSPVIGPSAVAAGGTADDCDGDKVPNARDDDDDNDLLSDVEEAA